MSGLKLVRQIAASPEQVFDAISTAEGIAHWFGPDAGPVLISEMTPRVGGRFRVRFRMLDQSEHECSGKILELTRPTHLLMTWEWAGREADGDSEVQFTLRAIPQGTELTFTHTRLPSDEAVRSHEQGWNGALDKLERRFSAARESTEGTSMQKITPFLWYAHEAEEAAKFYASVFPDSHLNRVVTMPSDSPSGPAGSVKVVDFTLFGQSFTAMSAGPHDPFNHAISFVVSCDSQEEVDRYWSALTSNGGSPSQCGWLKDRFGVSWQITPRVLVDMMSNPDRAKGKRVADAMMRMGKIDIAELKAAFDG